MNVSRSSNNSGKMANGQINGTSVAQPCPFLERLPREIRMIIYRHVFAESSLHLCFSNERMMVRDRTASTAMFAVSRICREEATAIFSSETTVLVSHDIDWHSNGLRELLLTNSRVTPKNVKGLDQKIVLKQLGLDEIFAKTDSSYYFNPEDMDIWAEAATVKALFPALETYFLTPAILTMFAGVEIGAPKVSDGTSAEVDTEAETMLAVQEAMHDPKQYGLAGFLKSDFVQSQLRNRQHPIRRWLYAVAGSRSRHADWTGFPTVLMDLSLCVRGRAWKEWPGIENFEWVLDKDQILENPTRFADRATPLVLPKNNMVTADCVHGVCVLQSMLGCLLTAEQLVRINLTNNTTKVLLGKSTVYLDRFGPIGAMSEIRKPPEWRNPSYSID